MVLETIERIFEGTGDIHQDFLKFRQSLEEKQKRFVDRKFLKDEESFKDIDYLFLYDDKAVLGMEATDKDATDEYVFEKGGALYRRLGRGGYYNHYDLIHSY